jgi:hypothetical protein
MPDATVDAGQLIKARQLFQLRMAVLPQYHPQTGTSHDGDDGEGHEVDFWAVPLMGPNRIGTVGVEMEFYGGVSYKHIGDGDASGHSWKVYGSSVEELGSGPVVASGTGTTFTWTPESSGTYRIELQVSNRKSDRTTDGARYVRVFASEWESDLVKELSISGSFSQESGGYELTVQCKPLDNVGVTSFTDWARIVIEIRTFYANSGLSTDDEYNYHSDELVTTGNPPSRTVMFNGLLLSDTLEEDPITETITFKMVSPCYALQKLPLLGYYGTVTADTDSGSYTLPVEYPLMFGDPGSSIPMPDGDSVNVVEYIREAIDDFPVHEVDDLTFTDPIYHLLQRHTNYMQWWDVYLEQSGEPALYPYSMGEGNVWAQLKKFQDSRMGVLFCSAKGVLYFSRDIAFQDDAWWDSNVPTVVMTMDRDSIMEIQVQHEPYHVAQVQLTGMDRSNRPYFSRFPTHPDTIGEIQKISGLIPFNQHSIDTWAGRLYKLRNEPDQLTVRTVGINRAFDIQDVVGVDYTDRAGIRTV